MTEKQLSILRRLYEECRRWHDHEPSQAEWEDFVVEQKVFGPTHESVRLAARVFERLSSFEVMSLEIETKVGDAESNLNNRKYNFGNF